MARFPLFAALPPVLFAGLAALFFFGLARGNPQELPSARVGEQVPALTVVPLGTLPGFRPAELAQGGVKLVNFWASWCAPCRAEHPNLAALAAEGLPIYGVNYSDDPDKALAFLAELGNPYRAIMADPGRRTGLDWGLYGVPETFVIDGDGTVVARIAGPLTERVIADSLRPALAEAAGGS